ncbi:MAG: Gx transporter family protein [Christensenellaceae bacterium]|nr:Gx transporter family protein [Christensenellaceae bacterium]
MGNRKRVQRVALCGILLALMLVLGFVESLIPVAAGVPGIKLGLSNGVLIFAVYMLDIPTAWLLMALKVTLASSLYAGFGAFPYALAGGVLSLAAMSLLSRMKGLHPVTVSMVGGVMHNVGQVGMAMLMLRTPRLMYYMAVLMLVGLATGALTGVCAHQVMKHLKHVR